MNFTNLEHDYRELIEQNFNRTNITLMDGYMIANVDPDFSNISVIEGIIQKYIDDYKKEFH